MAEPNIDLSYSKSHVRSVAFAAAICVPGLVYAAIEPAIVGDRGFAGRIFKMLPDGVPSLLFVGLAVYIIGTFISILMKSDGGAGSIGPGGLVQNLWSGRKAMAWSSVETIEVRKHRNSYYSGIAFVAGAAGNPAGPPDLFYRDGLMPLDRQALVDMVRHYRPDLAENLVSTLGLLEPDVTIGQTARPAPEPRPQPAAPDPPITLDSGKWTG